MMRLNDIGEEHNTDEIESNLDNNVVPKPEEFDKSYRRNTYLTRLRYVPTRHTMIFSFGFMTRKTTTFEEIGLIPINQTGYILNIDGTRNKEEIFKH